MVGADRYLSMQAALDQVRVPPVTLFKNMEYKDAEQHIAKLKALGVGFRVVKADDGTEDDSIMRDDELPGAAPRKISVKKPATEAAAHAAATPPPAMSVQDAISHHHSDPHGVHAHADHKSADGGYAGAGGGYGGGHGGSGAHGGGGIHGDAFYALRESEEKSRKKARVISVVTAAVIVVIALLFYLVPKGNKIRVNKIIITAVGGKQPLKGTGGGADNAPAAGAQPERQADGNDRGGDKEKSRNNVSNKQKQQANNYVDSAKTSGASVDKQVAFYKIAISFNRYNLQAWHGLLSAYREAKQTEEALATEAQMREIFGEEVNSINAAVTQFGDIVDAYTNESGAYRVEYKTKKTSKEEILRDVFNLTRAVRNACNCLNISIYASTGPGNGLMVHSTAETSVHTLPDFSRQANILWFD